MNNYLEAAGENLMFGGALPTVNGLIAADIEIRQNHLYKPFRWKVASGTILPGGTCAFDGDLSSKGEFFELLDSQGSTVKWYQCSNGAWVVTRYDGPQEVDDEELIRVEERTAGVSRGKHF